MKTPLIRRIIVGALAGSLLWFSGCQTATQPAAPAAPAAATPPPPPAPELALLRASAPREIAIHFISVGQGDCTLVAFPNGKRLLIDCGSTDGSPDPDVVREYISRNLDSRKTIDLLVITHPDTDHYDLVSSVLGTPDAPAIRVEKVMYVGTPSEYDGGGDMEEWLNAMPASRRIAVTNQAYNTYPPKALPGFESDGVKVLAANVQASQSPSNARSIVLKISHGTFDAMITGDATSATDSSILNAFRGHEGELDVEVWKGAHHGAWATATHSDRWAKVVKPEAIVFSASATNRYGHPNWNLAEQYKDYTEAAPAHNLILWDGMNRKTAPAALNPYKTEAMYLTATNGTIVIHSRGTGTFQTDLERN